MFCIACKHAVILITALRTYLMLNGFLFADKLSNKYHYDKK